MGKESGCGEQGRINVLLAGESWVSESTPHKG